MRNAHRFTFVLLVMSITALACGLATPDGTATPVASETVSKTTTEAILETTAGNPTQVATQAEADPEPVAATASAAAVTSAPTSIPLPSPSPTDDRLLLEIVQSQLWEDYQGNVRVNVLFRNPYDFPVTPAFGLRARVLNAAGETLREDGLYFLDGISGGGGFFLPGETIAATGCFTCEEALLSEPWESATIDRTVQEAGDLWELSTEVEAADTDVSFDGDSPIFWVSGTVTNNSDVLLTRISVRIFVYDQDGNFAGASEASAWDVPAGATVEFSGYGIGQAPEGGDITFEVTALGVNY